MKVKLIKKIVFLTIFIVLCFYVNYVSRRQSIASISSIDYKDEKIKITFNTLSDTHITCVLKGESNSQTVKAEGNTCILDPKGNGTLYVYQKGNLINNPDEALTYILSDNEGFYLIKGDEYDLSYVNNDEISSHSVFSGNESVLKVDGTIIKAVGAGETFLFAGNHIVNIKVTDLLVNKPDKFDTNKEYLTCGQFNNEENEIIDSYLKYYISKAGYHTRAGAVEAARFLTLNFPYKIYYFGENGRLTTNGIDGEGRYYHKGLYLADDKTKDITKSSSTPKCWSCLLPVGETNIGLNGLDCSGFITWALYNAGYDVGDIGAGPDDISKDLMDIGVVKKNDISIYNQINVGDLVHNSEIDGHIGMIVGIDNSNFYVAEALMWRGENGVVITPHSYELFATTWPEVILMDDFYKADGDLTYMWN